MIYGFHINSEHFNLMMGNRNLTTLDDELHQEDCLCGVPENAEYKIVTSIDDDQILAERVIGGEITRKERYPWTVRVIFVCLGAVHVGIS